MRKNNDKSLLQNFFAIKIILLIKRIIFNNYISHSKKNQNIKNSNYYTSSNKDNAVKNKNNNDTIEKQKKDLENNNKIEN